MNTEQEKALRAPFPPSQIGQLPKGGQLLDYVGHGAVTDRLLAVDPEWSWEPMALDAHGLPALDQHGNLWIKLTVCGVTRLGVGDGPTMKVLIGDALRNAAMRFGVALDLWVRGQAEDDEKVADQGPGEGPRQLAPAPLPRRRVTPDTERVEYATRQQVKAIKDATKQLTPEQRADLVDGHTVYGVELVKDGGIVASREQAETVLTSLGALLATGTQEPVENVIAIAAGGEPF